MQEIYVKYLVIASKLIYKAAGCKCGDYHSEDLLLYIFKFTEVN